MKRPPNRWYAAICDLLRAAGGPLTVDQIWAGLRTQAFEHHSRRPRCTLNARLAELVPMGRITRVGRATYRLVEGVAEGPQPAEDRRTPIARFRAGEGVAIEDFLKYGAFPRLDRRGLALHFGIEEVHHAEDKSGFEADIFVDDCAAHVHAWKYRWPRGVGVLWRTPHNTTEAVPVGAHSISSWDALYRLALETAETTEQEGVILKRQDVEAREQQAASPLVALAGLREPIPFSNGGPRCPARHQFGDDRLGYLRQCALGTEGEDAGHGASSSSPHMTEEGRWWCVYSGRQAGEVTS